MSTLNIVEFPRTNLLNIPEKLRDLAAAIEAGDHRQPSECVVVLNGDSLDIFGFGCTDGTVAHYLLACAQRKMEQPLIDRQP